MARVKRIIRTDCRPKFKTVPKATEKSAPIDGGVCFCSASKKIRDEVHVKNVKSIVVGKIIRHK